MRVLPLWREISKCNFHYLHRAWRQFGPEPAYMLLLALTLGFAELQLLQTISQRSPLGADCTIQLKGAISVSIYAKSVPKYRIENQYWDLGQAAQ